MPQPTTHPRTLPGTNLTPGELLRLIALLCGPPWFFAAGLFLTRLAALPSDALGWIVTVAAGPAAWGAFISAVADGRTLLGRPRPPDAPKRWWGQVIRVEDRSVHQQTIVEGNQVEASGDQSFAVGRDVNHGAVSIGNGTAQVFNVQGDLVTTAPVEPKADPARLEASYLRRVQTVANALPLAVIDPRAVERTRQQTMDLLPVYVALNTTTQAPVEETARTNKAQRSRRAQKLEPGREMRLLPVLEAAARSRLMVLLGDPGGGKSTFVNYLALCLAGARLVEMKEPSAVPESDWLAHLTPAWTHGPRLPLQVTLRQFARSKRCNGTAAGLWDFIVETLDGHGLGDFAVILRKRLLAGGVLVLLDGLDEVGDPRAIASYLLGPTRILSR